MRIHSIKHFSIKKNVLYVQCCKMWWRSNTHRNLVLWSSNMFLQIIMSQHRFFKYKTHRYNLQMIYFLSFLSQSIEMKIYQEQCCWFWWHVLSSKTIVHQSQLQRNWCSLCSTWSHQLANAMMYKPALNYYLELRHSA